MAKPKLPFKIRRLAPGEEPKKPETVPAAQDPAPSPPSAGERVGVRGSESPPTPETEPPAEPASAAETEAEPVPASDGERPATGGVFPSPAGVLAFLSAVAGMRLADEAACRHRVSPPQSPEGDGTGGDWWAEVELSWETAAPLVRTAGGRPYEAVGPRWLEVPILDQPSGDPTLDVRSWAPVDLADLVTTLPLRRVGLAPHPVLDVVVPGALGRWVLRRATALGLGVRLVTAHRSQLAATPSPRPEEAGASVLLIRLEAERGTVPLSLVQALTRLPYVVAARPAGPESDRLLVDVRHRPPLAESLVAGMIPEDEIWVLGGPDVGHWRLTVTGEQIDGADLLAPPAVPLAEAPATADVAMPSGLPVRLVARPGRSGPTDAVLLDESELGWLQRFLMTRPSGERAFLIPGGERYLLTAPGGLTGTLPFGVPLSRTGPRGLYVEAGLDFFPPLPEGARREVFKLDEGGIVAVVDEGAFRFDLERMVPAWTLWVGEAPPVRAEVSERSEALLGMIGAAIREQEAMIEAMRRQKAGGSKRKVNRSQLLEEAQKAEAAGDLVGAAKLLEEAGDLGPAGRLYERAAME